MTDIIDRQNAVLQEVRALAQQIVDSVDAARAIDPEQEEGPENQDLFPNGMTADLHSIYQNTKRFLRNVPAPAAEPEAEETENTEGGDEDGNEG